MRLLGPVFVLLAALVWAPLAQAVTIEPVTSPSGVKAWLVQDHALPIVTMRFAFEGGAALDPPDKKGTAAMVAALLDEGAGPYDTTAFQTRIEDLGSRLSLAAGQDEFAGTLRMLKPHAAESVELLRLALSEPRFAPDAIERIRSDILAVLARQARNPRSLSGRLWMQSAFEDHPYGKAADGTEKTIGAITRDDLTNFVARRLQRSTLTIGIVGDVTPAEASDLIEHVFGGLPAGTGEARIPDVAPTDNGALLVTRWPVPQSVVTFGQVGVKRDDPDWYAALILNDILGGGNFRGRLMREIRLKRGLAYGVSTELMPYRHAGLILGSVATENARVAQSIALIRDEWRRMHDEGPTEEELRNTQTYLTGSFPLSLDSTTHIAAVLVQLQVDHLPIDYLDHRADLINAVTLDQARAVAKRLYDPGALSFAVVGEPADVTPTRPALHN